MGNIAEIRHMAVAPIIKIKKLDADRYVHLETGEILEFKHAETRADNMSSVAQSLKHLRDIINSNVTEPKNVLWCTLTYRENMTDTNRLYNDFRKFNMRLKYYCKQKKLPPYEYIGAFEPQGRGAWHAHVLIIFAEQAPFIANSELAKIWRHGFVKVASLKNVDNVGLYLTAYLGDMAIADAVTLGKFNGRVKEVESADEYGKKTKKFFVKGARLNMYPVGFRLFRKSKGIKTPTIIDCTEKEAQKDVKGSKLTYEKTIQLRADDEVINTINYRHYKTLPCDISSQNP